MSTQNQRILLNYLGPSYSLKVVDNELCIYRKINEHYDIEISGTARKKHPLNVFVWDISKGSGTSAYIVEKYLDIRTVTVLKRILYEIIEKYNKQSTT